MDHAGVLALGAEQGEILQHRMRPYLRSRLTAASGAAKPIQFRFQGSGHFTGSFVGAEMSVICRVLLPSTASFFMYLTAI